MKKQLIEEPIQIDCSLEAVEDVFNLHGNEQRVVFNCVNCDQPVIKKIAGIRIQKQFLCTKCGKVLNAKTTFQKKYGVDNPMFLENSKEKLREYFKDTDWVEHRSEKAKETCKQNYGVENASQSDIVKEKKKETFIQHFGEDNIFKTDYFDKKRRGTNLERYGVEFASQAESVKEKQAKTNYERYGFKSTAQSPEVRRKLSEAISQVVSQRTAEDWAEIRRKSCKKYIYENQTFDSSWELALWIYAEDHNELIEREPVCIEYEFEGKVHKYFPDFRYKGELLEIKGSQFFDQDGFLQNPFDHTLDPILRVKQIEMTRNDVKIWSDTEIQPILDYIEQTYTKDYLNLFRRDLPFPYPDNLAGDTGVIRCFHKSIYEASFQKHKSPLQAWQDKNLVKDVALNRLKYVGNCRPETVLRGFSVTLKAPRVSVFRPKLAENLIEKYLNEFSEVFDPFSGFSGRMIGTAHCNKKYIGQDINEKHVKESNEIIQFLKLNNCEVVQQDILIDIEQTHECLFTCPPYGGKEHWNANSDEIEKTCDEWIDICLEKYNCKKYLFVVDETEKYKDCIVEILPKHSLFGKNPEKVVLIIRQC